MLNDQFPVTENSIYLNHAAVSPWPRVTSEVVTAFAQDNLVNGSLNYPQWLKTEAQLRKRAAQLINAASEEEIALVKNTSEGISFVAEGLDWKSGENVVGISQEFPSNRFPWMSLKDRGVDFRALDLEATEEAPETALMDLCDENTRVLAISAVQFGNGLKLNLETLGSFCKANDILFCVDAIQQIGALEFDVQAIKADFAIADGHKWMLGPEGLGIFYIRKDRLDTLRLNQYGWHMVEDVGNYVRPDFTPSNSATRFECGSPNMLGIHALNASLGLLLDVGMPEVSKQVLERSTYLLKALDSQTHIEVLTDRDTDRRSGIITFRSTKMPTEDLRKLLTSNDIFCAPRGGGIRLSPHFYTPMGQLDKTLAIIESAT